MKQVSRLERYESGTAKETGTRTRGFVFKQATWRELIIFGSSCRPRAGGIDTNGELNYSTICVTPAAKAHEPQEKVDTPKRRDFVSMRKEILFLASHVLTMTERSPTELKIQIAGLKTACAVARNRKTPPRTRETQNKRPGCGHAHLLSAVISHSFTVLSLEALTSNRLSADHATWYTAPTCPFNVARNVPVRPSHTLTFLSKEALAKRRPSGLKARWFTGCWWPVRRASIFLSSTGFQRQSVKSSEPDTNRSGSPPLRRAAHAQTAWSVMTLFRGEETNTQKNVCSLLS